VSLGGSVRGRPGSAGRTNPEGTELGGGLGLKRGGGVPSGRAEGSGAGGVGAGSGVGGGDAGGSELSGTGVDGSAVNDCSAVDD